MLYHMYNPYKHTYLATGHMVLSVEKGDERLFKAAKGKFEEDLIVLYLYAGIWFVYLLGRG